jgi:hypothetical protein
MQSNPVPFATSILRPVHSGGPRIWVFPFTLKTSVRSSSPYLENICAGFPLTAKPLCAVSSLLPRFQASSSTASLYWWRHTRSRHPPSSCVLVHVACSPCMTFHQCSALAHEDGLRYGLHPPHGSAAGNWGSGPQPLFLSYTAITENRRRNRLAHPWASVVRLQDLPV